MPLCKLCFEDVERGIPVPGYQEASRIVHEECLAIAALRAAEDQQKEGLLRYLIEYEEKHSPDDWGKEVSGGSADACWQWTDVCIPAARIRPLLNAGLVSIVFSTNSSTYYSLVGRQVIKETLGRKEDIPVAVSREETIIFPDDLFDCIIGYEDIKDEIRFTLKGNRRSHYLMIGPPATAKSLFLMELGRLGGAYTATGSTMTGPGLTDALINYQPRILLLDELDKVKMDATSVLLSVMESGEVLQTKYRRHGGQKISLNVFAAANRDTGMPPELLSRFDTRLYFNPYTVDEFIDICREYLSRYEDVPADTAVYIGESTWHKLDRDVRTARGIARRLRQNTREDVDRVVAFLFRYSKTKAAVLY